MSGATRQTRAEDLITVRYVQRSYDGIRPTPDYPSQPDHTEKE